MPRPAAHWYPVNSRRRIQTLRPNAPVQCVTTPDLDKICRLIGDALQAAQVLNDDRQICVWSARRAWHGWPGDPGSLTLAIDAIPTDRP
jgi:Holliday junction resolvase RusA-like endonuclease